MPLALESTVSGRQRTEEQRTALRAGPLGLDEWLVGLWALGALESTSLGCRLFIIHRSVRAERLAGAGGRGLAGHCTRVRYVVLRIAR